MCAQTDFVSSMGSVVCDTHNRVRDEAPAAYKDINKAGHLTWPCCRCARSPVGAGTLSLHAHVLGTLLSLRPPCELCTPAALTRRCHAQVMAAQTDLLDVTARLLPLINVKGY